MDASRDPGAWTRMTIACFIRCEYGDACEGAIHEVGERCLLCTKEEKRAGKCWGKMNKHTTGRRTGVPDDSK